MSFSKNALSLSAFPFVCLHSTYTMDVCDDGLERNIKTGTSPLAPGQWKPFLAVYAGFYVFNNIVRPLRLGASVVVAKYFDAFVDTIQGSTGLPRKWSVAAVVFLANVCGTFAAMGFGISLASGAAGVPIFPPKA